MSGMQTVTWRDVDGDEGRVLLGDAEGIADYAGGPNVLPADTIGVVEVRSAGDTEAVYLPRDAALRLLEALEVALR